MYNLKNHSLMGNLFCIGFMLSIAALAGCKDKEAIARADAAETQLQDTKTQLQATQVERDGLKTNAGILSKSMEDIKSQLNTLTILKDQVSAAVAERDQTIAQLKEQAGSIIKEHEATVAQIKDQINATLKERDEAIAKVKDAQATIEKMTSQLQEQIQKISSLEDLNKQLQAMIDELKKKLGGDVTLPQIPGL
jgi:chromosome segregation ATPase